MNKYLGPVSSPNCNTSQLNLIYLWFESQSSQPFFYWLNVGDGKETNLEICLRTVLQSQCIKYLGPVSSKPSPNSIYLHHIRCIIKFIHISDCVIFVFECFGKKEKPMK
ncbi:hypothetical protein ABKV19_007849 [Rosa sericea]